MTDALITHEQDKVVVKTATDVVAATVGPLRLSLREALSTGSSHLVVDLGETQMVDSMGIGLLISAFNSISKTGGQMEIVNASADLLALFKTMRMHQHFRISGK